MSDSTPRGLSLNGSKSFLGFGLVRPLRRTGSDFQTGGGEAAVASSVSQIVGTIPGELRWRPRFGVLLESVRLKNMDDGNMALAKLQVTESIREYEPRATLNEVSVEKKDTRLDVKVVWSVVATNNPRNGAILGPVVQVIEA